MTKINLKNYRLTLFKSNKHIYAQLSNDLQSKTIVHNSSLNYTIYFISCTKLTTYIIGQDFGLKMLEKCINTGYFNRNYKAYYGKIQTFLNGVRNIGIKI